jgi:type IV pilus assembly protein PilY1
MSTPEIGMLPSGDWVVIFGNGVDSASGKAALFIVNANTGALIKTIQAGTATGNGLGGVGVVRDANNLIVQAYAGDLKGNVWKFDLAGKNSSDWKVDLGGLPLFTATQNGVPQPITAAPAYTLHPKKGLMVIVPTGKLVESADASSGTQQTIYGLWDQAVIGQPSDASAAIAANKLSTQKVDVTSGSGVTKFKIVEQSKVTDSRGWQLNMLFASGERGIYSPQFVQGFVMVESVLPGKADGESCPVNQGSGYAYLINPFTGAQPSNPIVDLNGDGKFTSADAWGVFQRTGVGQSAVQGGAPKGAIQRPGEEDSAPTIGDTNPPDRQWRQIFRPITN